MSVLTADKREIDGVSVVDLNGQISLGESAATVKDTVRSLLAQGRKCIVLNLAGVAYVDSAGLGTLVESMNVVKAGGGQLKLLNLPKPISQLLRLTGLIRVFEVHEDESAAVRSFEKTSRN